MATNEIFLLFESAPGLLLSRVKNWDQIAQDAEAIQECCLDYARYSQVLEVVAFHPFSNAEEALEVQLAITNGTTCPVISNFLHMNLPSTMKKKKKKAGEGDASASSGVPTAAVGVCDPALGKSLSDEGFHIVFNPNVVELHRGCRYHFKKLTKQILSSSLAIERFQVGLGHSYSRSKMKEDPRKQDKPIMQSIALIDSLDKNINSFAMKLKEWYGWHFPELVKIVGDTETYCKVLKVMQIKEEFNEQEQADELLEACGGNEEIRGEILTAAKHSMGQEISQADFVNIVSFADQVLRLCEQRKTLQDYLSTKLEFVSPNLKAVVGEVLAARLISHAGALVNLAKYPASTIQILGAEKALFRALKSKSGRTPKYGILFHSSFIGRVQKQQHRGRMSRYLASKCALAARIDAFSEESSTDKTSATEGEEGGSRSNIFGMKLREQLEERLKYLADGIVPRKNLDVMREAASEVRAAAAAAKMEPHSSSSELNSEKKKKKKKKRKHEDEEEEDEEERKESTHNPMMEEEEEEGGESGEPKKKKKKKKKQHHHEEEEEEGQGEEKKEENFELQRLGHVEAEEDADKKQKKKKKKEKRSREEEDE